MPVRARCLELTLLAGALAACTQSPSPPASSERQPSTNPRATPPPRGRFVELALTQRWGCARDDRGGVWCWGDDPFTAHGLRPQPEGHVPALTATRVELPAPARSISAGFGVCATFDELPARCWRGGTADAPSEAHTRPSKATRVYPGTEGAVELATAPELACWRRSDGVGSCVADKGPSGPAEDAKRVDFDDGVDLLAQQWSVCALLRGGVRRCYTRGRSDLERSFHLWGPDLDDATRITEGVGVEGKCFLRNDATVVCSDGGVLSRLDLEAPAADLDGSGDHGCVALVSGGVQCWGLNDHGELGLGDTQTHKGAPRVPGLEDVVTVAVARERSCAASERAIKCWGDLGPTPALEAIQLFELDARSIHARVATTCAEDQEGTLWCWGDPMRGGVLGQATPRRLSPQPDVGAIVEMSGSGRSPCFTDAAGKMACGALSSPEPPDAPARFTPERHAPATRSYWPDRHHPCRLEGLGDEARVTCDNLDGLPKLVAPTRLVKPDRRTCALHRGGEVICWTLDRATGRARQIEFFPELHDVVDVTEHCALRRAGQAICYHDNALAEDAVEIAEDYGIICIRHRDGAVSCTFGELPMTKIPLPSAARDITVGGAFACAALESNQIACWGWETTGKVGAPDHVKTSPVAIEILEG